MPGFRLITRKRPAPSVVAVAVALVPVLVALMVAFGITAPVWSVTVPPIAPSVVDCAKACMPSRLIASISTAIIRTTSVVDFGIGVLSSWSLFKPITLRSIWHESAAHACSALHLGMVVGEARFYCK